MQLWLKFHEVPWSSILCPWPTPCRVDQWNPTESRMQNTQIFKYHYFRGPCVIVVGDQRFTCTHLLLAHICVYHSANYTQLYEQASLPSNCNIEKKNSLGGLFDNQHSFKQILSKTPAFALTSTHAKTRQWNISCVRLNLKKGFYPCGDGSLWNSQAHALSACAFGILLFGTNHGFSRKWLVWRLNSFNILVFDCSGWQHFHWCMAVIFLTHWE